MESPICQFMLVLSSEEGDALGCPESTRIGCEVFLRMGFPASDNFGGGRNAAMSRRECSSVAFMKRTCGIRSAKGMDDLKEERKIRNWNTLKLAHLRLSLPVLFKLGRICFVD